MLVQVTSRVPVSLPSTGKVIFKITYQIRMASGSLPLRSVNMVNRVSLKAKSSVEIKSVLKLVARKTKPGTSGPFLIPGMH